MDFEAVLDDLDSRGEDRIRLAEDFVDRRYLREDLARAVREYFDELRIKKAPGAYAEFAQRRVKPGDVVITFNYDVSLERELKRANKWDVGRGYGFSIFQDRDSSVELLKLPGSTNWIALMFDGSKGFSQYDPNQDPRGSRSLIYQPELEFLGHPDLKDPKAVEGGCDEQATLILPARSKIFDWPFWKALWDRASCALNRSDRVFIFGYSMLQVDSRARDLLFGSIDHRATLTVCSRSHTNRIANEFRARGFATMWACPSVLFEEWVRSPEPD